MSSELSPAQELQLQADINGARGPEQEAAAEAWAEENGYEITYGDEEGGDYYSEPEYELEYEEPLVLPDWLQAQLDQQAPEEEDFDQDSADFGTELESLESHIGRRLTEAELNRLYETIPAQGPIPNLVEKFGKELASRGRTGDGRRAHMAEVVEDQLRAKEEAEGAPERAEVDLSEKPDLKTQTREERIERMAAAGEAAQQAEEAESPAPVLTPGGTPIGESDA